MPRGTETVTIVKTVKRDKLSTAASTPPAEFDIEGVQVLPRTAKEDDGGWVNIEGWDIFCLKEPSEPVLSSYQVRVRGVLHNIEGTPGRFDKRQKFKALKITAVKVGVPS